MNMGNVRRSIAIDDGGEDIFSDDIKTTALIEEIEAAEVAAKQAQIEKQIETSQPTAWQKFSERALKKVNRLKTSAQEKLADLTTKAPEDPRVKKTGLIDKIDQVFDRKIEKKRIVGYCVGAALVVTAGMLWAWNLSHPLFKTTETVENVPVTGGGATPTTEEVDDDSPFSTEQQDAENDSAVMGDEINDSYTDSAWNSGARAYQPSNTSSSSANTNSGSARSQSTNRSSSRTTGSNNQGRETVDNSWGDGSDIEWPQDDQGDEQSDNVEATDETGGEE